MLGKELGGQSILLPEREGVFFFTMDGHTWKMSMHPAAQAIKLNKFDSTLTDDTFALAKLGDWLGGSLCFWYMDKAFLWSLSLSLALSLSLHLLLITIAALEGHSLQQ